MSELPFIKRPRRGIFKRSRNDTQLVKDLAIVTLPGFIMAGTTGLSFWLGYELDERLNAHGLVFGVFILLGILRRKDRRGNLLWRIYPVRIW